MHADMVSLSSCKFFPKMFASTQEEPLYYSKTDFLVNGALLCA